MKNYLTLVLKHGSFKALENSQRREFVPYKQKGHENYMLTIVLSRQIHQSFSNDIYLVSLLLALK